MAYTPTEWETGDVITAEKLNKLENGLAAVGDGAFKVTITATGSNPPVLTMNKTWQEIKTAYDAGHVVVGDLVETGAGSEEHTVFYMVGIKYDDTPEYTVVMFTCDPQEDPTFVFFTAEAATGYPTFEGN